MSQEEEQGQGIERKLDQDFKQGKEPTLKSKDLEHNYN